SSSTSATSTTTAASPPPPSSPAPPTKKSASRCKLDGCSEKVVKIIGLCRYCAASFCAKHRLPEAHRCDEMQTCRQAAQDRLAGKLLSEKCVAAKV
ncbi:hypothetical protein BDZ88DRAFT_384614, partial [Geranomyces variabilis]